MKKLTKLMSAALVIGLAGSAFAIQQAAAPTISTMAAEGTPNYYPDKATNISVNFVDDSTTGTVTFTAPSTMGNGRSPVGWLKYEVRENLSNPNIVLAAGDCEYGQEVTTTITTTADYHQITIYMINEKGQGSPAWPYCTFWAGPGKPAQVKNVKLTGTGNDITLTWDAVTEPTNSIAFFVPEEVTYKIVRMPDQVTVADGHVGTTFTETVPSDNLASYSYDVWAQFRGQESGYKSSSNGFAVGTATPAWSINLTTVDNFNFFTSIDGNADGTTWSWSVASNLPYVAPGAGAKDDYLVSPAITMEAGKLYPVEVVVSSYSTKYNEVFEVVGGTAPTLEALTQVAIAETNIATENRTDGVVLKGHYLAPVSGDNYLAIHAKTPSKTYDCFALNFAVGEGIQSDAPEAVSAISITSDPDVTPATAEISFTAPVKSISGAALAAITKIEVLRNDEVVKTFDNPAPGAALSFSDIAPANDTYTYKFIAYNAGGAGRVAETSAFVGDYRTHAPYSYGFDDNGWLKTYTVLNVDADNYTWEHDGSYKYAKCSSSGSVGDDYLITPKIFLRAGYRYTFSFNAKSYYSGDPVPFEVLFGTEPTAAALTKKLGEVAGTASFLANTFKPFSYNVDIEADGEYCFAIRYLSADYACILCIDDIAVSDGLNIGAPKAIEDLTVTPDFGGELKAVVAFTAPSQSMADQTLAENLSKIEIYRDDELINTLTNVAPGSAQTFTDVVPKAGYHTYAVTPYATTKGETSKKTVYVGANVPLGPTDAELTETTPGTVRIFWSAPVEDVDGNTLNQDLVSYTVQLLSIYGEEPVTITEGIKTTDYTYAAVSEGQRFVSYRVYAVTAGGASTTYSETETIPVGTPETIPYLDSFAEGKMSHEFLAERAGEYPSEWRVYSNNDLANLEDQDGNNGVIGMYAPYTVGESRLITGKIDLTGASTPTFSIWYRAVAECACNVGLDIRPVGETEWTRLAYQPVYDATKGTTGWLKISAALDQYVGRTVQLAVYANMSNHNYLFFDNLRIAEQHLTDMSVNAISAPARMYADEAATITATVQNIGQRTLAPADWSIELLRNGEKVQTMTGNSIAIDELQNIEFAETLSSDEAAGEYVYTARIVCEADGNKADNTSEEAKVQFRGSVLPAVNDLTATTNGSLNTLTWSAPATVTETTTEPVTEDFESYTSFAKSDIGDWLLVDMDKEKFGGFYGLSLPGIAGNFAYFVMDNTHPELAYDPYETLKAKSGNKFMVSACTEGPTMASDDWLISPQVSQSAHTASFWAKSYESSYLETFEVLYSLDTRAVADFHRIRVYADVPIDWTEYKIQLPEGTRYFAIRCLSTDKFMLFIDDITFTPMVPETEAMVVKGYNVYRDGELLNAKPITSNIYVDSSAELGAPASYTVKTIFAQGISAHSNKAELTTGSLANIAAEGINVYSIDGAVVVEGAEGLEISLVAPDGRIIATAQGAARTTLHAPAGLLLVKVGASAHKVIVK